MLIQIAKIPVPYPAHPKLSQSQKLGKARPSEQTSALPVCFWLQSFCKQSRGKPHHREQLHLTELLSLQLSNMSAST